MELAQALMQLEAAAATVGHLLPDSDEALKVVADGWAPLKPRNYSAIRWDAFWLAWLRDCADRLPATEAADQPSAQELEELIMRWCASGSVSGKSR